MEDQIIPSVRDLEPAGQFQPLREIKGILENVRTTYDEQYNTTHAHLDLIDLEVIESTEPYEFPITDIRFPYNRKEGTRWGIFSKTVATFLEEGQDIGDLKGCQIHLKMEEHMLWDGRENKRTPQLAWELVGVEGTPTPGKAKKESDALSRAIEILDGLTIQKFNSESLKDPIIRGDSEVSKSIQDRTFIPTLISEGVMTVDEEGVHHLVKPEPSEESPF